MKILEYLKRKIETKKRNGNWREAYTDNGVQVYYNPLSGEFRKGKELKRFSWNFGSWARNAQADADHFSKDLLQPFNKDGTVNREFMKAYKTDPRTDEGHSNHPRNVNNNSYTPDRDLINYEEK